MKTRSKLNINGILQLTSPDSNQVTCNLRLPHLVEKLTTNKMDSTLKESNPITCDILDSFIAFALPESNHATCDFVSRARLNQETHIEDNPDDSFNIAEFTSDFFDEASLLWRKNKRDNKNGTFNYICHAIKKNGKKCIFNSSNLNGLCKIHNKTLKLNLEEKFQSCTEDVHFDGTPETRVEGVQPW